MHCRMSSILYWTNVHIFLISFVLGEAVNVNVSTFVEYRSLCNKIWQIFKFYSLNFTDDFVATDIELVCLLIILFKLLLYRNPIYWSCLKHDQSNTNVSYLCVNKTSRPNNVVIIAKTINVGTFILGILLTYYRQQNYINVRILDCKRTILIWYIPWER